MGQWSGWVRRVGRGAVGVGAAGAVALTVNTALNLRFLRVPLCGGAAGPAESAEIGERVSVLVPARDEAGRIGACLRSLQGQRGVADLEILVCDNESTDGTARVVGRIAEGDARVRVIHSGPLPEGWYGRAHACACLATAASGSVYVFLDADMLLAPDAVAAMVALLRDHRLDMVCPMPALSAVGPAERLVQPLVQWAWRALVPARLAERSPGRWPVLVNGIFAVDAAAYHRHGGHTAVAGEILEDMRFARALTRGAGTAWTVEGAHLASCRMYEDWAQIYHGYTRSMWRVWGTPGRAAAAIAATALVYVLPPLAALTGSPTGALGYGAAVAGRVMIARRTHGRVWPDSLTQPVSVVLWSWLISRSFHEHRAGTLAWKGRPVGLADRPRL